MTLQAYNYPREWLDRIVPRPGMVLVERDENPTMIGHIILPDTFRQSLKKPLATIFRTSHPDWERGDRVILAHGVAQRLEFGDTDPTILYLVNPRTILARLHADVFVGEREGIALESTRLDSNIFYIRNDIADEGVATKR